MKNRTLRPIITNDGSYTLEYKELEEHYHSKDGAKSESEYVYLENGLEKFKDQNIINVFEIGVGTGLNVLLSLKWAQDNNKQINYTGIEPFPVDKEIIDFLVVNDLYFKQHKNEFLKIHHSLGRVTEFSEGFKFDYRLTKLEELKIDDCQNQFNLIYFDAFAPSRQENIWSESNIKKCFEMLRKDGILTTYSASGAYKRSLRSSGFDISKLPGFGQKREMIIGKKP